MGMMSAYSFPISCIISSALTWPRYGPSPLYLFSIISHLFMYQYHSFHCLLEIQVMMSAGLAYLSVFSWLLYNLVWHIYRYAGRLSLEVTGTTGSPQPLVIQQVSQGLFTWQHRANPEMQILSKSLYHIVSCPLAKSNNMVHPKSPWEGTTKMWTKRSMNNIGHYGSNTTQQRKCQDHFGAFGQNRGYMFEEA